ncbi:MULTISPECIES: WGR domain-containing protein [Bradyrhizobium]|uniref:WGR domain-containing protein n=1 Tax=Bradyrhizobium TaxID=374 RepID=UPI002168282E|nr:WGR domain-containing protein [Bradyrhizobium japonicum]
MTRIDDHRNMARFYKLDVQPAFFGWSLGKEWERLGRAGTVRIELHETRGNADIALISKWTEKQKSGYR